MVLPFLHQLQGLVYLDQLSRHSQQFFRIGLFAALNYAGDHVDLCFDQLALRTQSNHRQGVRDNVQIPGNTL